MNRIKVLYVEDELFLAKIVSESLESRNFEVLHVPDGLNCASVAEKFKPDIFVLDVMLPRIDGFELAQQLKMHFSDIPIIFLTAKSQQEDVIKGFQSGGNDFIRKPFSMEELIVRIQNLLHLIGRKEDQLELYHLGTFHFFPQRQSLCINENCKRLSHRETELLQVLVSNLNENVTRKYILLKLWGDDSIFNSRNLDVYITKLREYLRADPNIQIITLKGVGYRLIVESILAKL